MRVEILFALVLISSSEGQTRRDSWLLVFPIFNRWEVFPSLVRPHTHLVSGDPIKT
jgi:hypothetical protein